MKDNRHPASPGPLTVKATESLGTEGWPEVRLAEVCDSIDYGLTASASEAPAGPRFLRITDIVPGHIDWHNVPYVEADSETASKYRLKHGDVVIARTGATTGVSAYVANPPDAVFASYLVRLKVGKSTDARFISYFLKSERFWDYMRGVLGDKSAQPNASARTMTQAKLRLPPLAVQTAIAHVLGTLDDKIELNRRRNETLEAMARAVFKSWFVDFDPVRAKAGGRRPPGLDPATATLFPAAFQDSPLGPIARGWEVGCIGDVAENPRRGVGPDELEPGTPYVALEHMPRRCIALDQWGVGDEVASGKFRFRRGEILFGKLRPYFHKVGVAPVDGVCSTDILVVVPKSPEWFAFVLGHVSSDEFVAHADAGSTGTKMPRTNWQDMGRYEVAVPPDKIALAFGHPIAPLIENIIANIHQSRTLAAIRDALLPKLLSGEIRIPDAEKMAGEVT